MEKYGYVYITTNLINNKKYIGQHKSKKFDIKYLGSGTLLKRSILKRGRENFKIEIIEWCIDLSDLNIAEEWYIAKNKAVESDEYYNISQGGKARTISEEHKRKISIYRKGKKHSEETKIKLKKSRNKWKSSGMKNKKHSKEAKKKIGLASKGRRHSEESKQKMSNAHRGKLFTEEHKRKIGLSSSSRLVSEETRNKISVACKGKNNGMFDKKHSEETKRKMSISKKGICHIKTTCPYCNKIGGKNAMKRYHFDNCKHKIIRQ